MTKAGNLCVFFCVCDCDCHMSHCACHMSNAYVDSWDMLNNFCFHVYAQMLLFMDENVNGFFLTDFLTPM